MEEEEILLKAQIHLSAHEFIRAMKDGYAKDENGVDHKFLTSIQGVHGPKRVHRINNVKVLDIIKPSSQSYDYDIEIQESYIHGIDFYKNNFESICFTNVFVRLDFKFFNSSVAKKLILIDTIIDEGSIHIGDSFAPEGQILFDSLVINGGGLF